MIRYEGFLIGLTLLVAACGGGGSESGTMSPATVRTLAYVVTDCRGDAQGATMRQSLQIRQGDRAPISVVEHSAAGTASMTSICFDIGVNRQGADCARRGVFHRLGVTPDGSAVVFEVTDEDSLTAFPRNTLPTEQKGIFIVGADGNGVRRLGPPSREPPYVSFFQSRPFFAFSPDGRTVAYTDRGPSRDNVDAVQIFTRDLATGSSTQVTYLPPARRNLPVPDDTCCPFFTDNYTIAFLTYADVKDQNPQHQKISVTVKTDGAGELTVATPPVVIPGSQLLTTFHITGSDVGAALLSLPGIPTNGVGFIQEVFAISGDDVLQLTTFERFDTDAPTLSADGQRVFFAASPPLATNPTEDCQIWSIDRNGGDLRQLTQLHEGPHSTAGCVLLGPPPLGCTAHFVGRDTQTDDLVFISGCDPVGANPYGLQVFAIHQDGAGLRQLTNTQGYRHSGGTVNLELPYPFAHPRL